MAHTAGKGNRYLSKTNNWGLARNQVELADPNIRTAFAGKDVTIAQMADITNASHYWPFGSARQECAGRESHPGSEIGRDLTGGVIGRAVV